MTNQEKLIKENAQLRALLLRCKTQLSHVDPLSDSHEQQIDALYDDIYEALQKEIFQDESKENDK